MIRLAGCPGGGWGWVNRLERPQATVGPVAPSVHTLPVGDAVMHDGRGLMCICGPTVMRVLCVDGTSGWLMVHHALDGRE